METVVTLDNLGEYDKTACLERLKAASDTELWDVFLEVQANLFFNREVKWMEQRAWWPQAEKILEIGSGNGAYLSRLAAQFQEKVFQGVEKLPLSVKQANERFARDRLSFREGDAEIFDPQRAGSADIVLFRLTLQHLSDPNGALRNAFHYLAPEGHVLIIDSYDRAGRSSHPIAAIEDALQLVAERQREKGLGNRKVTLDLLKDFELGKGPLCKLYDVAFTNLNAAGEILCETLRFSGERDRRLSFTQNLLFLDLLHRTYQIPIDLDKAYDQLKTYLEDETAWSSPGMHFLVLKKKK